jgi:beta-phosphoglucomutase-like phosphatase (HAD superfamily)
VVVRGNAEEICAGAIAARYEALGGKVRYFGKPYPEVYERCLTALGSPPRGRILAVGDLRTDIAGAAQAGIDRPVHPRRHPWGGADPRQQLICRHLPPSAAMVPRRAIYPANSAGKNEPG